MRKLILAISATALAATAAWADVIADRQAIMKERGGLVGSLAPINKGEKPFDAAMVKEVLAKLEANAKKFDVDALYPVGSENDPKASPKIWSDRAGFKAAADKFTADVASAIAANPQDLDAFKPQFGKIAANCGACHTAYRQ